MPGHDYLKQLVYVLENGLVFTCFHNDATPKSIAKVQYQLKKEEIWKKRNRLF